MVISAREHRASIAERRTQPDLPLPALGTYQSGGTRIFFCDRAQTAIISRHVSLLLMRDPFDRTGWTTIRFSDTVRKPATAGRTFGSK